VFRGLAPPVMRRVKAVVTWNYEINGNILRSKARQLLNPPIQKRLRTAQARASATFICGAGRDGNAEARAGVDVPS
jgi:hypothetical protein